MKKVSQKTLDFIKKKNIKPVPRSIFILKNLIFWLLYIISLTIGAISTAIIIFDYQNHRLHQIPYIWFFLFLFFIVLSVFNFQKTKKSYLFPLPLILISNLFLSILFGSQVIKLNLNTYQKISPQVFTSWQDPKNGYLAGRVISAYSPTKYLFVDLAGNHWQLISPSPLIVGTQVKLIGTATDNNFNIKEIRPWFGCGCQNKMK